MEWTGFLSVNYTFPKAAKVLMPKLHLFGDSDELDPNNHFIISTICGSMFGLILLKNMNNSEFLIHLLMLKKYGMLWVLSQHS